MEMIYIGIDPGFSGAWGAIDHHGAYLGSGLMENDGYQIDTRKVVHEIRNISALESLEIVIEAVHAMPGQGVSSTFKFGQAYGSALAIAQSLSGPMHLVAARTWKKDLGLDSDKGKSLDLARIIFPTAPLKRKKDNGVAEALLMAEWQRRNDLDLW